MSGDAERLAQVLDEIQREAEHGIPYYAYGDNEAGVNLAHRLARIEELVNEARGVSVPARGESPRQAHLVTAMQKLSGAVEALMARFPHRSDEEFLTPLEGALDNVKTAAAWLERVTVHAIDAQGTAQFLERNAAQIAGEVARQASHSRSLRRWPGSTSGGAPGDPDATGRDLREALEACVPFVALLAHGVEWEIAPEIQRRAQEAEPKLLTALAASSGPSAPPEGPQP